MAMLFRYWFLWLITLTIHSLFAQTPAEIAIYTQLRQLKIPVARQLLAAQNEDSAFKNYLESYADMVSLLIGEDQQQYNSFVEDNNQRLKVIDGSAKKSPYRLFLQAEIRIHTAFVQLKLGHEIKGSWNIIKASRLLEDNRKQFPNFVPHYKSLGLLHILFGAVPQNFKWVTGLLGLKGNIKQGLAELQMVIAKDAVFADEAQLASFMANAFVLPVNERKIQELLVFTKNRPDQLLAQFFCTTLLIKEGHGTEALQLLNAYPTTVDYFPNPFTELLKGEIYLQRGQYGTAIDFFQAFLKKHQGGMNFIKDACYKIFLCYWLANNNAQAKFWLEQIPKKGNLVVEADKTAQKFAERFGWNSPTMAFQKILTKARFACDGGYYEQALDILKPFAESQLIDSKQKAEFSYRKGRIYQRMNNGQQAIVFYERAIMLSQPDEASGALAALQMGYIYQQKGQKVPAIAYFEKAMTYQKHEYKNSVDNKARAALENLL